MRCTADPGPRLLGYGREPGSRSLQRTTPPGSRCARPGSVLRCPSPLWRLARDTSHFIAGLALRGDRLFVGPVAAIAAAYPALAPATARGHEPAQAGEEDGPAVT